MTSRFIVYLSLLGAVLGGCEALAADAIECTAQVTIHKFKVTVDPQTPHMSVITDTGSHYQGSPTVSVSAQSGDTDYFLATGFGTGLDVDVAAGRQPQIALCLSASECYLCR